MQAILDGMAWLGMHPDEGPFFQSRERERHVADARRALAAGHAYRCSCTPEEVERARELASREGRVYVCERRCRERDSREGGALRFKVPPGRTEWTDLVHGPLSFDNAVIEDFVLLRSDETPTYMLSVVSDDAAMRITHVVRGDDHVSNTPKQIPADVLGVEPPAFAHR